MTKINSSGQTVWTKRFSRSDDAAQTVDPLVVTLNNGNLAYAWTRDTIGRNTNISPPTVYILTPQGQLLDSIAFHGNLRTLAKMHVADNGDILGAGTSYSELGYGSWMFRITENADLVWERYLQDNRLSPSVGTFLYDVNEMSDGSVLAAGCIHLFPPISDEGRRLRSWVVKLDADGCLDPGCTNDTIHLMPPVSTGDIPYADVKDGFNIFPNPVEGQLTIGLESPDQFFPQLSYIVHTVDAKVVATGQLPGATVTLPTNEWPPGLLIVSILSEGRLISTRKIVKQ